MLDPLNLSIPLSQHETRPQYKDLGPRRYLLKTTDKADEFIMEMDYSGASDFMCCARRAENKHVFGRELAKDQSALGFGRLFHKLTEARDRNGLTPATLEFQKETTAKHFMEFPCAPTDHRNSDMMFQVMKLYNERWLNDGWQKKVFMFEGAPFIERPFKIELCTVPVFGNVPYAAKLLVENNSSPSGFFIGQIHVHLIGRIDLVLEELENLWIVDRKTSSRDGGTEVYRLSLQTRLYAWALWQITGRRPLGCIIDSVVCRAPTKTGKNTTLDRQNYFYSEDSLLEAADCMRAHCSDFIGCLVRGFWPQAAQSFKSPCVGCDYAGNCILPLSQRAADLSSDLYRDVTWNPLTEQ